MAELAQIEAALRAADAAGNAEDARRLAQAYAAARAQQHGQQPKGDRYADLQRRAAAMPQGDPTEGMSGFDKFMAGVGKSVYDTGRGAKQLFGDVFDNGTSLSGLITGRTRADERRAEVDAQRRVDAPLMNTGWGVGGNIAGTVGQVVSPGGLAKLGLMTPRLLAAAPRAVPALQAVKAASLPSTVRGTAAQGGLIGLMQQVGEGDSRLQNTAVGGIAGAVGAAAPRLVGATSRAVGNTVGRFTKSGAQKRAVQQVLREAENPAALLRPQPSQIPGVRRTLAQESLDPGVARLERNARSTVGGFDQIDSAANTARAEAIRNTFEGASPASAAAIRAARDQAADDALAMLPNAGAVDKSGIQSALEGAVKAHAGNPATQQALKQALAEMPEITTAREAYNFRKYVDFLMSKQSDKPVLKMAKKELMGVKGAIDDAMTQAYPGWQKYLDDHVAQSRRADQSLAGAALLRKGSAIPDPVTGEIPLSPAQVSRVAADPDAFAAQVTRFPQARAASTFTQPQLGLLGQLQDDMSRVNAARTWGSGGNSQSFERFALRDRAATSIASKIPGLGGLAGEIGKIGDRKVQEALGQILADPSKYRSIVARFPPGQRRIIQDALNRIGGTSGALALPIAE